MSETFLVGNLSTFDVAFSGTVSSTQASTFSYSIIDSLGTTIASHTYSAVAGSELTNLDTIVSFATAEDFTVTFSGDAVKSRIISFTVISPSQIMPAVPVPASALMLVGGLGALAVARRKKA